MFCPQCKAEYRPGSTHCSDCDVERLPEEEPLSGEEVTLLWWCNNETECVGVCRELKKADIPCKVEQIPNKHYHILVSPNALDLARKAANLESIDKTSDTIPSSDADEEEVFDPTAELLDAGVPLTAESRRRDTYLDPWYPEDATVAVWSQDVDDLSSIIELSLDANRIHWRCDSEERGAKKIFVRPEDEPFARESLSSFRFCVLGTKGNAWKIRSQSLQLGVFGFGLLQDGNVGVGVFPEGEEVFVRGFRFGGVARHGVSPTQF